MRTSFILFALLLGCGPSVVAGAGGGSSSSSSSASTGAAGGALVCPPGFADCGDGQCSTNVATNPLYCGGCDVAHQCILLHAVNGCDGGACIVIGCDPGFADCNSDPADGCETDTLDEPNCGGCGVTCDGGFCNEGACKL